MADRAPTSSALPSDAPPVVGVLLAAGVGSRLRGVTGARPKVLLEVGGRTLLSRSLAHLRRAGIDGLVVVTGYRRAVLEDALETLWPGASTVVNDDFASTGSMRSLARAADALGAGGSDAPDVLVAESDLVYESRALDALLGGAGRDVVLVSGPTGAGDEVWVCGRDGRVREIAKSPSGRWTRLGELVGLTRLSGATLGRMAASHRTAGEERRTEHYEERLSEVAGEIEVRARKVEDLIWGEIDHEAHLERVREEVLPALREREGHRAGARPEAPHRSGIG